MNSANRITKSGRDITAVVAVLALVSACGRRADARLDIVMTRFQWDVSVGNNVAIRIDFKVTGFVDGKSGSRNITYISERAKVPEWITDSGKRIRQKLTTIMDEASQTIWQQILDRDG